MAGIVIGWYCKVELLSLLLPVLLSLLAMLYGMFRFALKWLFGAGASLFMLSLGMFVEECKEAEMAPQWSSAKQEYSALLVEEPLVKGTTVKVLAELVGVSVTGGRENGLAYLYFPRCVEAEPLKAGSMVSFTGTVQAFENAGNPAEFDSERYYYIKGITGYCHVGLDGWRIEGDGELSLASKASRLRSRVVEMYKGLSFEGDELALLSALTIGERSDFPRELKEKYSAAGASHVLALSGMHLGVFYMILVTLVPLWSQKRHWLVLREVVIVLLLWGFAFVAGLPPSVVRAALLFTLISLGRCLRQDSSGVSSLSFAAITMLLFSPHLLFDVSFQLSFAAVFAILLLAPPMQRFLRVEKMNVVCSYVVNLLILSLVAQLGTLPFVWYYFGLFPVYFLLTNIVVVPLAFVLMSLAVLVWALAAVPFMQGAVALLLKYVVWFMNGYVETIASLPGASLSLPPLSVAGACLAVLITALLCYSLARKVGWLFFFSLCCILCSSLVLAFMPAKEIYGGDYIVIYNNGKNPLLHVVTEQQHNYLVSTVPQLDAEYEYSSSPFIKREGLPQPVWVNGCFCDSTLALSEGLLEFNGLEVRLVDNAHWQENMYVEPADIVILCRGFLGRMAELVEAYPSACLVLDASLYKHSRQRILRECAALGVDPVDISDSGAMMVVSSGDSFRLVPVRGK